MAQTKRKRRSSKHRGNAAGLVEQRGRTGRKLDPKEQKKGTAAENRAARLNRPPSWRSAANRALIATGIFFLVILLAFKQKVGPALGLAGFMLLIYIPLGYYTDMALHKRHLRKQAAARQQGKKPSGSAKG